MKNLEHGICYERIVSLGLENGKNRPIKDLIDILIQKDQLKPEDRPAFETSVLKQIFNINEETHSAETSVITPE